MGDTPTTVNEAATIANKILRTCVDGFIIVVDSALMTQAPWLKLPIVSQIYHFILNKLGDKLYEFFGTGTTFLIIDFQTVQEKNNYMVAIALLREAEKSGDPNAINEAREKAKQAMASLIHWDGSANP